MAEALVVGRVARTLPGFLKLPEVAKLVKVKFDGNRDEVGAKDAP